MSSVPRNRSKSGKKFSSRTYVDAIREANANNPSTAFSPQFSHVGLNMLILLLSGY